MNILILNGSPKGKDSVTLQTMEYLQALFPQHTYEVLHVGRKIRRIERDFSAARAALEAADLIVFCYPVYTFLVPAQLHRFIELVKEDGIDLSGKWATQVSTSKHFYDVTAHRFIADNCADLGLRYTRGLSADMDDILEERGQREAEAFFRFVLWNIGRGFCDPPAGGGASAGDFTPVIATEEPSESRPVAATSGPGIALVTDYDPQAPAEALVALIQRFRQVFPGAIELVNLHEFPFAGGCLGCFNCASDGTCVYKDGFSQMLRERINSADAVVYAYTIRDHSMGYRFKLYDDRQFCNGHRTVTMGKPVAYLVDGNLAAEDNLRMLMEARAQVGGNFLAGIATDEVDPDAQIDQLAATLAYAIKEHHTLPKNFYGVGGLKIFRDLIYQMQGLMKEDHRFYKEHGFYDFPQKQKRTIAFMYLISAMMGSEKLKKKSKFSMTDGMLMPYKKVIEEARKSHPEA